MAVASNYCNFLAYLKHADRQDRKQHDALQSLKDRQSAILAHITTPRLILLVVLVRATIFEKHIGSICRLTPDRDEIWHDCSLLRLNTHPLTESDL